MLGPLPSFSARRNPSNEDYDAILEAAVARARDLVQGNRLKRVEGLVPLVEHRQSLDMPFILEHAAHIGAQYAVYMKVYFKCCTRANEIYPRPKENFSYAKEVFVRVQKYAAQAMRSDDWKAWTALHPPSRDAWVKAMKEADQANTYVGAIDPKNIDFSWSAMALGMVASSSALVVKFLGFKEMGEDLERAVRGVS